MILESYADIFEYVGFGYSLTPALVPPGSLTKFHEAILAGSVNITLWGDSNTMGNQMPTGSYYEENFGFQEEIKKILEIYYPEVTFNISNLGVGGAQLNWAMTRYFDDGDDGIIYWHEQVQMSEPDLLFITFGTNAQSEESFASDLILVDDFIKTFTKIPSVVWGTAISWARTIQPVGLALTLANLVRTFAHANNYACLDMSRHQEFIISGIDVIGVNQQISPAVNEGLFFGSPNTFGDYTTREPFGGNGYNHPSAIGWAYILHPEIKNLLKAIGASIPAVIGKAKRTLYWTGTVGAESYNLYLDGNRFPDGQTSFTNTFAIVNASIIGSFSVAPVVDGIEQQLSAGGVFDFSIVSPISGIQQLPINIKGQGGIIFPFNIKLN